MGHRIVSSLVGAVREELRDLAPRSQKKRTMLTRTTEKRKKRNLTLTVNMILPA
jgi:hypothetical protein